MTIPPVGTSAPGPPPTQCSEKKRWQRQQITGSVTHVPQLVLAHLQLAWRHWQLGVKTAPCDPCRNGIRHKLINELGGSTSGR